MVVLFQIFDEFKKSNPKYDKPGFPSKFVKVLEDPDELRDIHQAITNCTIRARLLIVIHRLEGRSGPEIARLLNIGKDQVYYWFDRYKEEGLVGLRDKPRKGRPPKVDYDDLQHALQQSPRSFGIEKDYWTPGLVYQYLRDYQQASISENYVYELLDRLEVDIADNTQNERLSDYPQFPDIRTVKGDILTPLHLEVLSGASVQLDAPIHKIITDKGIKPVLEVVESNKSITILQGNTENGRLTVKFETF